MTRAIVVMGVSGCGKSTVGALLAAALPSAVFLDADDLHPAANRARMTAGIPLTDQDREPWLRACAAAVAAERSAGRPVVLACSALRRSYRDLLVAGAGPLFFVHLRAAPALIAGRLHARQGHFMPAGLLASQLETLEDLELGEYGMVADVAGTPGQIVRQVLSAAA
ncbi:gluconokinase [Actinoplanes couchii]|uniref:Gluconokinase n=1 Tax=Actinoplanes couchii TaxID=403638 RepID=A0ABQ3XP26_9ACTN|nr:gluconokinase [Actinoplanes couchii]MDR6318625.1 carbohydrate kinase (thermoresistant glucokinase family) [Actinoplanes couchii]GID60233.1 gluconokinase [Actinoplanes couchii]